MADYKGFQKYTRKEADKRSPEERIGDYKEIYLKVDDGHINNQAARCMDCGVPFCHNGCPLGNKIPDFNDAVYLQDWRLAYDILRSTNNFPEFTGRICPAPCEGACVLGINNDPVAIEFVEKNVIETAYKNGWVQAENKLAKTGKKIAVIGSGPAGMAATDQLAKMGHDVTLYEKAERIGGLLRYGIPDFKLEKWVIDRRMEVMSAEGVKFVTNCEVGKDITMDYLNSEYDAVIITIGAGVPRDLPIPGRDANGVYFAMEFLGKSNQYVHEGQVGRPPIDVKGKNVVVIGGGDTGSDCVGTSHRQGAKSVTQLEVMYKPKTGRGQEDPWPKWPMILRTSTSHEEGGQREWSILTKEFIKDDAGNLVGLNVVEVEWAKNSSGQFGFNEVKGTERVIACEAAFLAVGFLHGAHQQLTASTGIDTDPRGNIATNNYQTTNPKIFAAGDARRGQSLVVWAIMEGREAASAVHKYLGYENVSENNSLVLNGYEMQ
jgi:glutamate synthase (NADPH/NADH) small chain